MSAAMPSFRNSNTIFCNLSTFWEYAAVSFAIGPPATPFYAIAVAGFDEVPGSYPIRYPCRTETSFSLAIRSAVLRENPARVAFRPV
jgi:hypothetical protein